jgi:hypothetical protein
MINKSFIPPGNASKVKSLLQSNPDLALSTNKFGETPLHILAIPSESQGVKGRLLDLTKILVENYGAPVDKPTNTQWKRTPLMW